MSGRPSVCRELLLAAIAAALLGHVCGLEIGSTHGPAEHARSTGAAPAHEGPEAADLHAGSCDGIKPTSMEPLVSTVDCRQIATVRLEQTWSRSPPGISSLAVSRPALFLLHASFLI